MILIQVTAVLIRVVGVYFLMTTGIQLFAYAGVLLVQYEQSNEFLFALFALAGHVLILLLALLMTARPMWMAGAATRGIAGDNEGQVTMMSEAGLISAGLVLLGVYFTIVGLSQINALASAFDMARAVSFRTGDFLRFIGPTIFQIIVGIGLILGSHGLTRLFLKIRGRR